jgi:hypothetical protein
VVVSTTEISLVALGSGVLGVALALGSVEGVALGDSLGVAEGVVLGDSLGVAEGRALAVGSTEGATEGLGLGSVWLGLGPQATNSENDAAISRPGEIICFISKPHLLQNKYL